MKSYLFYFYLSTVYLTCFGLGGGEITTYKQVELREYSLITKNSRLVKAFDINESTPYVRYFNNSYTKVISHHSKFHIIDGIDEEEIDISPLIISNKFYFDISPDNKEIIFTGTKVKQPLTFTNKGLYKLNLETREVSPFLIEPNRLQHYPKYSHSGDKILFKSQVFQKSDFILEIMNIDKSNRIEIIDKNVKRFKFGPNDKKIYMVYYTENDKIMEYNISSQKTTPIITARNLFHNFVITNNAIYFDDGDDDAQSAYHPNIELYKYSFDTKKTQELFAGMNPMNVVKDQILYMEPQYQLYKPAQIRIHNNNNNDDFFIDDGNFGMVSSDGKRIFLWSNKEKTYQR